MRLFRVALFAGVVLSAGSMAAQPLRVHTPSAGVATGHLTVFEKDLRADQSRWSLLGSSLVLVDSSQPQAVKTGGLAKGERCQHDQHKRVLGVSGQSKVRFTAAATGGESDGARLDRGARFRGLLDRIKQPNGGFTVHAVTGRQPTTGYALSIYKDRETTKPAQDLELSDLVRFAKVNEDLLCQPDNYVGVWHDPKSNLVYMDISIVVRSAAEAERLGRQNQQGSYFNLEESQLVDIEEEAA